MVRPTAKTAKEAYASVEMMSVDAFPTTTITTTLHPLQLPLHSQRRLLLCLLVKPAEWPISRASAQPPGNAKTICIQTRTLMIVRTAKEGYASAATIRFAVACKVPRGILGHFKAKL